MGFPARTGLLWLRRATKAPSPPGAGGAQGPVLAVELVWLAFLAYPLIAVASHPPAPARLWPPLAGLAVATALYVWLAWRVAFPRRVWPSWPAVGVLVGLAVALPLGYGADWLGLLLYVAVLGGFALAPARAVLASVVLAAATAGLGVVVGTPGPQQVSVPLATALAGVVSVVVGTLLRTNRELLATRGEVERLAAGEERMRLARDLHDAVKQQVFVAAMEVGAARTLLEGDRSAVRAHLCEAEAAIGEAQRELAAVIDQLRPPPLDGKPLADALRVHLAAWSRRYGIASDLRVTGVRPIPAGVAEALFRVGQEALTNVARHSGARQVGLALDSGEEAVTLTVVDDGRGFPHDETPAGHGLAGMRERLAALGGSVTVAGDRGAGTTVTCACPRPETVEGG